MVFIPEAYRGPLTPRNINAIVIGQAQAGGYIVGARPAGVSCIHILF